MPTIVTVTANPTLDKSADVEHVMPEHKLRCSTLRYQPGGGGLNVARAIKKLGGSAMAFYLCGGANGQVLHNLLEQEEIGHQFISIEDTTREGLTVFETSTSQQYRFNLPGPTVQEAEWSQLLEAVFNFSPQPDYLVGSGSLPPGVPDDFYARLAHFCRNHHCRFVLDTSSRPAMHQALAEGVYLIKPNIREFRQLVGRALEDEIEQESQARQIVETGQSEVVVVSLGGAGVLLVTKDECRRIRAPTVKIESKVGAGDSTVGGIVLSLAHGKSVTEAVRYGVAAGAAAVTTPGTELCRRQDTEELYQRITRQS